MFRDNEASRVGEVLAAKLANDVPRTIAAAVQLWLAPREDSDGPDEAAAEAWTAIVELEAVAAAVDAGMNLVREQRRIRRHALVDLVEAIGDGPRLLEIATVAVSAGWDVEPVFARLVDVDHKALQGFIATHRDRLREDPALWILVGFTLATSPIGDRFEVDAWFAGWEERAGVPMWLIAAYAGSIAQLGGDSWDRLIPIARSAIAKTVPDATAAFFETFLLVDELRSGRTEEFAARLAACREALAAYLAAPNLEHPLVGYANAAKHRRPLREDDFAFERADTSALPLGIVGEAMTIAAAAKAMPRPPDWRLVEVIQELTAICVRANRILPLFAEMFAVERGDPRAVELYRAMAKARPKEMALLQPHWKRLVNARIGWFKRFRLEMM